MEPTTPTSSQPTTMSTPQPGQSPSLTKKIVTLACILALVILAGIVGYAWWKHSQPPRTISGQRLMTIQINHDKINGNNTFTFKQNEPVAFVINGDSTEERDFVIPAYDISTTFSHNSVGNAEFVAAKTGSFPIYLHDEDGKATQIGKVLVR